MKEVLLTFVCGLVVGVIFKLLKLPLPAPSAFSGVMGILGLYLGNKIFELVIQYFGK